MSDKTGDMMLALLRELMDTEPPRADADALVGSAYYEAADVHYAWSQRVSAFRLLLGVRLVNQALEAGEEDA